MKIEIHLQEGFFELPVTIRAGDRILAKLNATTRLMTGLAEIVSLELSDGEEVSVLASGDPVLSATITVDKTRPYIAANIGNGALRLTSERRQPGYL